MKWLSKKWLIPVGALVVVLAMGAYAFATTQDEGLTSTQSTASQATDNGLADQQASCPGQDLGGWLFGPGPMAGRGHGMRGFEGGQLTDEQRAALEQRRQEMQNRQQAMLNLLREKMSVEDKAKLDELLKTADEQRQALEQARKDLGSTMSTLRDLVNKYLDELGGGSGQGTSGS